jgi:hypothetical protein
VEDFLLDFISSPLFVVPTLVVLFFAAILWATRGITGSESTHGSE